MDKAKHFILFLLHLGGPNKSSGGRARVEKINYKSENHVEVKFVKGSIPVSPVYGSKNRGLFPHHARLSGDI